MGSVEGEGGQGLGGRGRSTSHKKGGFTDKSRLEFKVEGGVHAPRLQYAGNVATRRGAGHAVENEKPTDHASGA